ncbi:MAG TPA: SUMF1/EgtB/PvdO family nonheme iron enzyme [Puia sp.]|nr:SUMF1/EgtB/PvdO family nonheme iron enzyme [Puia sp.]
MKKILLIFGAAVLIVSNGYSQQPQGYLKELFAGPGDTLRHADWLASMRAWRVKEKDSLRYSGAVYLRPELKWTRSCYTFTLMMPQDRYFYDPVKGRYTVDRYLNDLERRYGGIDGVLIWPTYPNIGIDSRNQFDLLADLPGGIAGVRQMVADFSKRGVRVFFPIMIWDRGTHPFGNNMPLSLIREMQEVGADGMNGDTMGGVPEEFSLISDSLGYPMSWQPEWAISNLKMLEWNTTSWGYFWTASDKKEYDYPLAPGVSVYKWLEPRHQLFVCNRWVKDRTDDLQYAFFNGTGYNTWENVWGIWNQVSDRDGAAIRRIVTIYRRFPDVWSSPGWEPHIITLQKGIFASCFPGKDNTVYVLVNRDSADHNGRQLRLHYEKGVSYFDLWNGLPLRPEITGDSVYLSCPMEGRGYGALLVTRSGAGDSSFIRWLRVQHAMAVQPLKHYSTAWRPLPQQMVPITATPPSSRSPEGMVLIPAAKQYIFRSKGVMLEGDQLSDAIGIQHPWQASAPREQQHVMDIPSFYIDIYPVTNSQFKRFIDVSHYHPGDDHNFLKDWKDGTFPEGWADGPVTWVSIEDARAYAAWAGKRLPHEWEWQYAAQGMDDRLYPWGNEKDLFRMPPSDTGRIVRPPGAVTACPQGASPFGVMDLMGNVWQWTDEYRDEHTRSAVLKGGSYYKPKGNYYSGQTPSGWYFPWVNNLREYGKYLLLSPGMDRSATIGFRCVKDR